mgnify:CR=1 FL=1
MKRRSLLTIEEPTVETITYKRKKTKGQRDIKLENLPKEIIEYRLPEEDQVCSCCNRNLHEMSTEIHCELKVIPAEVKVIEHVQHVYSYLMYIFEKLPNVDANNENAIDQLLPWSNSLPTR